MSFRFFHIQPGSALSKRLATLEADLKQSVKVWSRLEIEKAWPGGYPKARIKLGAKSAALPNRIPD